MNTLFNKIIHEPFVHFFIISLLLYLIYSLSSVSNNQNIITIDKYEIQKIKEKWKTEWKRTPNSVELKYLIENKIDEKILFNEALSMGLEKDDLFIHNRLVKKTKFLFSQNNDTNISEDKLKEYFNKHKEDYIQDGNFTFYHVYIKFSKNAEKKAKYLLTLLKENSVPPQKAKYFGDNYSTNKIENLSLSKIAKQFGIAFSKQLSNIQKGEWKGPLVSKKGLHLIYITKRISKNVPKFEEVKFKVQSNYKEFLKTITYQKRLNSKKSNYTIKSELK